MINSMGIKNPDAMFWIFYFEDQLGWLGLADPIDLKNCTMKSIEA